MAEEFQAGICGGSWWNPARSVFMGGSSPCSVMNSASDVGTYGSWVTDMVDLKARSCKETNNSLSDDSSIVLHSSNTPQQSTTTDSDNSGGSGGGGSGSGSILIDSTLQMMGFGISSPLSSSDWNHSLLRGRGESYNFMLQENMNSGLSSSQQQKDWSPKSFTSTTGTEDSTITAFKAINHQDFSLDQQQQGLNHVSTAAAAGNSTATCQGFSMGSSGSYGYPLQGLFEPDPQPQQSLFNNRSTSTYGTSLNHLSHNWPKLSPSFKPSLPKQQHPNSLHFSNNTPFWNASANSFLPSSQPQIHLPSFEEKPSCTNIPSKGNNNGEDVVKKGSSEPAIKRPRIETPSPLPTFKVRKEKLGDRITALQQLVSPFGKNDTASVLHEAIEYIKFLHDQVNVLSTPYMKNNNAIQPRQGGDRLKEAEGPKQDLRSRGLCLVPISSTFPVANETTADFWTPTFGATFR